MLLDNDFRALVAHEISGTRIMHALIWNRIQFVVVVRLN